MYSKVIETQGGQGHNIHIYVNSKVVRGECGRSQWPNSRSARAAAAPLRTTPGRPSSAAPTTLPKASGTATPVTPPKSAPAVDKGKSNAKGKWATSDDAGRGKSKSKGDSHREKGKAKGTHYGKGKGQK